MSDESNLPENQDSQEEALKDLVEQEVLTGGLRTLSAIFIGLALLIGFHSVYTIVKMLGDRSLPLVVCPREYTLDAPVVMKTIERSSIKSQDRWIRGFMRRFLTYQFPRSVQDVKPFFNYIYNHSKGDINLKFESYLKDVEAIQDMVKYGNYFRFYPKDSKDLRIRPVDGYTNRWVVEIDGYLIKKMSLTTERFTPVLRYTVESGEPTMDNPEGLYVIEGNIEQYVDYVSGKKENL